MKLILYILFGFFVLIIVFLLVGEQLIIVSNKYFQEGGESIFIEIFYIDFLIIGYIFIFGDCMFYVNEFKYMDL